MVTIQKAKESDFQKIVDMGRQSFLEAHPNCAPKDVVDEYLNQKFNAELVKEELEDERNIFHIICYNNQTAGYSKIIFNHSHSNIKNKQVTKLERLYLLKDFYGLNLGTELFEFNKELSQKNAQRGMWLFVWVKNLRAINFYKKVGFKVIGSHDFKLSATYSNPNHQMFLEY